MKNSKRLFWLLTFLPLVVTLFVLPLLPAEVPMHYNIRGEITRWGSKYEQLLLPIAVIGISLILHYSMKFSSKIEKREANQNASIKVGIATLIMFNGMNMVFLYKAYNESIGTGVVVDVNKTLALIMGLAFVLMGNALPKCKQNVLMGIRTPWTLMDEEVWYKSHRVGGPILMIICGLSTLVAWLFLDGMYAFLLVLGGLILSAIVLTIYSYVVYKKKKSI